MKTMGVVVLTAAVTLFLWCMLNGDGRAKDSAVNVADNIALSVSEKALPPQGDTSRNAVIRKAMLEQRERENREWTASNINAHPDLYLDHCGKMLSQFLKQYEDSMLEVRILMNQYGREMSDAKEEMAPMVGFLRKAKSTLSNKEQVYPSKVGLYTYASADKVVEAVRATDKRLTELEGIVSSRSSQIESMKATLEELTKGRDVVMRELRDLDRKREQAKAKNMQKAVEGLQARMNALLSGVSAVVGDEETAQPGVAVDATETEKKVEDIFSKRGIE